MFQACLKSNQMVTNNLVVSAMATRAPISHSLLAPQFWHQSGKYSSKPSGASALDNSLLQLHQSQDGQSDVLLTEIENTLEMIMNYFLPCLWTT